MNEHQQIKVMFYCLILATANIVNLQSENALQYVVGMIAGLIAVGFGFYVMTTKPKKR